VFCDVDEVFGTGFHDKFLLWAVVYTDDAESHATGGELDGDVAEAPTRTGDDDPLAGFGIWAAEGGVGGYTGTEHGLSEGELNVRMWGGLGERGNEELTAASADSRDSGIGVT